MREPFDLAASLIARCNGAKSFFPLTRAMYKDQPNWVAKIQTVPPAQIEALPNCRPTSSSSKSPSSPGCQQWAAMRGVPAAKSGACLTNEPRSTSWCR